MNRLCIADAYAKQRAVGFVPYVSVVQLDVVRHEAENQSNKPTGGKDPAK